MTQRTIVPALTALVILFKIGTHVPLAQEAQEPPKKHPQIAKLEAQIAGKEQLPAEEVWKNIQTFKGRPSKRVSFRLKAEESSYFLIPLETRNTRPQRWPLTPL